MKKTMASNLDCKIVPLGKRRDGGTRYWCLNHRADATAKYGVEAASCRYAHVPEVTPEEERLITLTEFPFGVAFWGAVPPIYDTSVMPIDRGIHVHARKEEQGEKSIDQTYRRVKLRKSPQDSELFEISELDAIYYMISSIFGYEMAEVRCTVCDYSHLDKDWFSLHPHHRHLCSGCGNYFRHPENTVGNPLVGLQKALRHVPSNPTPSKLILDINQVNYPGGIQIWGSNPAIFWTNPKAEESGIHVHLFDDNGQIISEMDNTYGKVIIDGIELDSNDVRMYMAQSILPHIKGRTQSIYCTQCNKPHTSKGENAFTPSESHECDTCGATFRMKGRKRKVISNSIVDQLKKLSQLAPRSPQTFELGLLPETI